VFDSNLVQRFICLTHWHLVSTYLYLFAADRLNAWMPRFCVVCLPTGYTALCSSCILSSTLYCWSPFCYPKISMLVASTAKQNAKQGYFLVKCDAVVTCTFTVVGSFFVIYWLFCFSNIFLTVSVAWCEY